MLAQQFDRGQDLRVASPLSVIGLGAGPPDVSIPVDQKVGAVGVELVFIEDAIGSGNVSLESLTSSVFI